MKQTSLDLSLIWKGISVPMSTGLAHELGLSTQQCRWRGRAGVRIGADGDKSVVSPAFTLMLGGRTTLGPCTCDNIVINFPKSYIAMHWRGLL